MKTVLLGLLLFLPFLPAHSLTEKKQLGAIRSTGKITIDGVLNEPIWQSALPAKTFVTYSPTMGLQEGHFAR
jgi:hypothetical protein